MLSLFPSCFETVSMLSLLPPNLEGTVSTDSRRPLGFEDRAIETIESRRPRERKELFAVDTPVPGTRRIGFFDTVESIDPLFMSPPRERTEPDAIDTPDFFVKRLGFFVTIGSELTETASASCMSTDPLLFDTLHQIYVSRF